MTKEVLGELEGLLGMREESLTALEQIDTAALQALADGGRSMLEAERQALESELVDARPRIPGLLAPIARRILQ